MNLLPEDVRGTISTFGVRQQIISNERVYEMIQGIDPYFNLDDLLVKANIWNIALSKRPAGYDSLISSRIDGILVSGEIYFFDPIATDEVQALIGIEPISITERNSYYSTYYAVKIQDSRYTYGLKDKIWMYNMWKATNPLDPKYFSIDGDYIKPKYISYGKKVQKDMYVPYNGSALVAIQQINKSFNLNNVYQRLAEEESDINWASKYGLHSLFDITSAYSPIFVIQPTGSIELLTDLQLSESDPVINTKYIKDTGDGFEYLGPDSMRFMRAYAALMERTYEFVPGTTKYNDEFYQFIY